MTDSGETIPPIADAFFLTGPTAGGKTKIGVRLAKLIGAEVISLDSMAVYRMMDIGTAKPTEREREGVPHHLIDIRDPWEEYSLAGYLKDAARVAGEIRSRGRRVLFVGGTPLYLKGALCGIFEGPPADEAYRAELAACEAAEPGALHRPTTRRGSIRTTRGGSSALLKSTAPAADRSLRIRYSFGPKGGKRTGAAASSSIGTGRL